MKPLIDLFTNPFVMIPFGSWAEAQVLKMLIHWWVNKKFDINRLFGDGGMPSGHSATVCSLATITGLMRGFGTFEFAMAFALAVIVCHDAMGVRLETGKQSMMLNEIIKSFNFLGEKKLPEVKLKEFVGHTPSQVAAGVLLGICNSLIIFFLVPYLRAVRPP